MKKNLSKLIMLFLASGMMITGCANGNSVTPNNPEDPIEPGEDPTDPVNPEEESELISVTMCFPIMHLTVNNWEYLTVNTNPEGFDLTVKGYTWSSSNTSVATVSEYGKVSAKSEGEATITFTAVEGNRTTFCKVYVHATTYHEEYRFQKMSNADISTFVPGDIFVMACPEKNAAAGLDITGRRLNAVDATFSSDKSVIETLDDDAVLFMIDGEPGAWTLENQNGKLLAATNEKKVTWVEKTGNILWNIEIDTYLVIESAGNDIPGWMMYNADTDAFTLYESNPTQYMYIPTLYRYTPVSE